MNAIFRTETFQVAGETNAYVSTADSGSTMRRRFCQKCGTPLFSEALSRPDIMVVRAGALDDPEIGRPTAAIWTASAPSWVRIDGNLSTTEGQPVAVPEVGRAVDDVRLGEHRLRPARLCAAVILMHPVRGGGIDVRPHSLQTIGNGGGGRRVSTASAGKHPRGGLQLGAGRAMGHALAWRSWGRDHQDRMAGE